MIFFELVLMEAIPIKAVPAGHICFFAVHAHRFAKVYRPALSHAKTRHGARALRAVASGGSV